MTRASKGNQAFKRLNNDLDLDLEPGRRNSSSAASKRTGDLTLEERRKMKEQLREWKAKKVRDENTERLDRIAEEKERQARMQRKVQEERQAKRDMIEEFKYRKEMEKHREMVED